MYNQQEHWAVFPEDPRYSASDLGRIKNNETGKILVPFVSQAKTNPYYRVHLSNSVIVGVHYIVLASFVPKPEADSVCDHINRNSLDNRLENLRWVSFRANVLNSERCTIYSFKDGEYLGEYKGWKSVADAVGLTYEYVKKRSNGRKHYTSNTINGVRYMSEKKYRKLTGYKRFIIPISE